MSNSLRILNDQLPPPKDGYAYSEPVSKSVRMAEPAEKAWELISRPNNLERFHPFCAANPVESWPGIGARDRVEYHSGLVFTRDFTHWTEGQGYQLEIGVAPKKTTRVVWVLTPEGASTCTMRITLYAYVPAHFDETQAKAHARMRAKQRLDLYLESVVRGIAHVLTTGTDVQPDQFGWHPVFSKPHADSAKEQATNE